MCAGILQELLKKAGKGWPPRYAHLLGDDQWAYHARLAACLQEEGLPPFVEEVYRCDVLCPTVLAQFILALTTLVCARTLLSMLLREVSRRCQELRATFPVSYREANFAVDGSTWTCTPPPAPP